MCLILHNQGCYPKELFSYDVAPSTVSAPVVQVVSGNEIDATWSPPVIYTGPIATYILRAYNLDNVSAVPLESATPGNQTKGCFHVIIVLY